MMYGGEEHVRAAYLRWGTVGLGWRGRDRQRHALALGWVSASRSVVDRQAGRRISAVQFSSAR